MKRATLLLSLLLTTALTCGTALAGESDKALAGKIVKEAGFSKGLCVVLGAGNVSLAGELAGQQSEFLVQVLGSESAGVERGRKTLSASGLYGRRLSVVRCSPKKLPYPDNFVNLVVIAGAGNLPPVGEIRRALRPGGVVWVARSAAGELKAKLEADKALSVARSGAGLKALKRRPAGMDDWSHPYYDAAGNPASRDRFAGPPFRTQWIAGPRRNTGDHFAGGCGVSAQGRIFYTDLVMSIWDKQGKPAEQVIHARDAHNGLLLWRKVEKISKDVVTRKTPVAQIVAAGDTLFNIGTGEGCQVIDGQTGKVRRVLNPPGDGHLPWVRVVHSGGRLFGAVGYRNSIICGFDPASGKPLWSYRAGRLKAHTLVAGEGKVFFQDGDAVVALDAATGKPAWKNADPGVGKYSYKLCAYKSGRLFLGGANKVAISTVLSAADGKVVWQKTRPLGSRHGFFLTDDLVVAQLAPARDLGYNGTVLLDQATGKVRKRLTAFTISGCLRTTMVGDWIFGRSGFKCLNLKTMEQLTYLKGFLRTSCAGGLIHANGLSYALPNDCICAYYSVKGLTALAPAGDWKPGAADAATEKRLVKGPAYGRPAAAGFSNPETDWCSFKHDVRNSGVTGTSVSVPGDKALWEQKVSGVLTPPVAGGGLVFVGTSDHQVRCFDAGSGKPVWSHTAGGAIRFSPTLYQDLLLFGSEDGWVTCLDARTGKLVWRFRAAPEARWITRHDRLVSTWAIGTDVLVDKDVAYFSAGRIGWDGVYVHALDARSGKVVWQNSSLGLTRKKSGLANPNAPAKVAGWKEPARKMFEKWWKAGEEVHVATETVYSGASPDGIMSVTDKVLIVPQGYRFPLTLARTDGQLVRQLRLRIRGSGGTRGPVLAEAQGDSYWFFIRTALGGRNLKDKWHRGGGYYFGGAGRGIKPPAVDKRVHFKKIIVNERKLKLRAARPTLKWHAMHFFPLAFCGPLSCAKGELYGAAWHEGAASDITGSAIRKNGEERQFALKWVTGVPMIARAMAVTKENIFCGGSQVLKAGEQGLLCVLKRADGKKLHEFTLPASPVEDGIAAAGGRLFVACEDGVLRCFGKK